MTAAGPRPGVLHVVSSMGRLGGGAERQLLLYLQHRSERWRHVVAYRKPHHLLRDRTEETGTPTVWLGPVGFTGQLRRLTRLARAESVDVIHTHLFEANLLGRVAGRLLGLPVVSTVANTLAAKDRVAAGDYAAWKYRLGLATERVTARLLTERFVAISETVKASTIRTLGVAPARIDVVYRAVRGEPLGEERRGGSGPVLITTGRLVRHKGQDLLIRMLPLVREQWPTCVLRIVGDGTQRGVLERLAGEVGVAANVEFLGLRDDVAHLLGEADVYVYASWFEGFANAFAEAVARGVPVVAVDLPVFKEIAPPQSVLLVRRDERALAEAVLHVLSDLQSFREVARRNSVHFRERFSIARYVEGVEAVYQRAAAGHGRVLHGALAGAGLP